MFDLDHSFPYSLFPIEHSALFRVFGMGEIREIAFGFELRYYATA